MHKELLKKVRRIEIRTSHIVDEMFSGQYHSAFKGRGIEFEEVRPYQVGDDVRAIDWNVTARFNEPFVKLFREERELTVMLLADFSASQSIGTAGQLKRELIAELGATLAFSAIRNNDKVGMIGFTDDIEKVVPVRKGPRHVLRVIRELLYCRPIGAGTNITRALEHLNKALKRRAVVFLISDFQDAGYEKALRVAKRGHDLIPIVISDRRELELPDVGLLELMDAETNRRVLVDTFDKANRRYYARRAKQEAEERKHLFRKLDIESIELQTGEDFVEPLRKYFYLRERRQCR
ncbi:MAG: DUF58 domain-containing protein [Phycisphaerae bacterium]|nr:DUF58 domain-containing protein [Phycisphaerae bacterium]